MLEDYSCPCDCCLTNTSKLRSLAEKYNKCYYRIISNNVFLIYRRGTEVNLIWFSIQGIVEGMGSGLITVAHNSGGPQSDIIGPAKCISPDSLSSQLNDETLTNPGVGYLASTAEEYASVFEYILLRMSPSQFEAIQNAAESWVSRKFSEECFSKGWLQQMERLNL